jgi:hypothetical protein
VANTAYTPFKVLLLGADIDLLADTIKCVLLDNDYTISAAHDFLDDVAGGAIIGTAQTLASKTATSGNFDSADVTFTAVAGGDTVTKALLYKDTGSAATSPLIVVYDTNAAAAAISITTNGGDIVVAPHANGWFSL